MTKEHDYTSCSDKNLYNAGYNCCRRCTELQLAKADKYDELHASVANLIKQKGRHNTEKAYEFLVRDFNELNAPEEDEN